MAIIELNLEKPALKRVESVEETPVEGKRVEDKQMAAEVDAEEAKAVADELTSDEVEVEDQSGGKSRVRKYGRRLAIVGGTAAGAAAVRKLRQRRKSKGQQQELEEDWQTAESTDAP